MKQYTNNMKHKGFTVVELIIVIVVIGILAAITIVSYAYVRDDGMDAKIKAVVRTAGDAMQLREGQTGGSYGQGYFSNSNSVDSLVPKYLKQGYRDGLNSKNAYSSNLMFRIYSCNDGGGGFIIYAALNNPSSDDIASFNSLRSACGHSSSQAPNTGSLQYNYAQVF